MKARKIIIFILAAIILVFFYLNFFNSTKVLAVHGTGPNKEFLVKNMPLKLTLFQSGSLTENIKSLPLKIQVFFQIMILIIYYASVK